MYDLTDEKDLRALRLDLIENENLLSGDEASALLLAYQDTSLPQAVKVERDALLAFLPAGHISKLFAIAAAQLGLEIQQCEGIPCDESLFDSFTKRLKLLSELQFAAILKPDADPLVQDSILQVPKYLFDSAVRLSDANSVRRTLATAVRTCDSHHEKQAMLISVAKQFPGDEQIAGAIFDVICSPQIPREDRLDICEELCSIFDNERHAYAKELMLRRKHVLPYQYFSAEVIRYLDLVADHFELPEVTLIPEIKIVVDNILADNGKIWDEFDEDVLSRFHLEHLEGWTDNSPLLNIEARIEERFRCLWAELKKPLNAIKTVPEGPEL